MPKWLPIVLLCVCPLLAQKYDGPRPPKTDLPYLQHADNLVPTESADARQEEHKNEVTYVIAGANSPARTPLSSPIFLFQSEEIAADRLQALQTTVQGRTTRSIIHPQEKTGGAPRPAQCDAA